MPFRPRFSKRGPLPSSSIGGARTRRPSPRVTIDLVHERPAHNASVLAHEGHVAEHVGESFLELRNMFLLNDLQALYDEGDWIELIDLLDWLSFETHLTEAITPTIKAVIQGEGWATHNDTMRMLNAFPERSPAPGSLRAPAGMAGSLYATGRFDMTNPFAIRQAEGFAADLVREISRSTQRSIRDAVVTSFREGVTVDVLAKRLRDSLGLTSLQARAVHNYRDRLERGGMDLERVDVLTRRYWRRTLNRRAQTIARTEIMRASNFGRQQAWLSAADAGLLDANMSVKEWVTAPEGPSFDPSKPTVCPLCGPMDGVKVMGLETPFKVGRREVQMPPSHPNCRCTAIVWPPEPPEDFDPDFSFASVAVDTDV